jgi:hypothetical protein
MRRPPCSSRSSSSSSPPCPSWDSRSSIRASMSSSSSSSSTFLGGAFSTGAACFSSKLPDSICVFNAGELAWSAMVKCRLSSPTEWVLLSHSKVLGKGSGKRLRDKLVSSSKVFCLETGGLIRAGKKTKR